MISVLAVPTSRGRDPPFQVAGWISLRSWGLETPYS